MFGFGSRESKDGAKAAELESLKADLANLTAYADRDRHPDDADRIEELKRKIAQLEGE